MTRREWTCPHGVIYKGNDDFLDGVRQAHDETADRERVLEREANRAHAKRDAVGASAAHWRKRVESVEAENRALVEALVVLYRTEARAEVARLCDESIDPSGALLGRIRRAAFSSTEGAGDG